MAWRKRQLTCSFCGKPEADVAKLVAGPHVFICDACVAVAVRLMQEPPAGPPVDAPRPTASSFWHRLRAGATLIASRLPRKHFSDRDIVMNETSASAAREHLRHTVATLSYRAGNVLRGAPAGFGDFKAGPGTRTPAEILAHVGDLLDWALSAARGAAIWHNSTPGDWAADVARFYEALARFDAYLASDAPLGASVERLFQGPVADALTHVGQLAMLRRLADSPIRGENYCIADIAAGRTGLQQSDPVREFD